MSLAEIESRDTRGPIDAAKALFARKPEMVGAFLKVIEAARKMDAEELVARVTRKPVLPQVPIPTVEPPPLAVQPAPVKPGILKAEPAPEKKPSAQPTLF
ncbi:MAG: hypothetical protein M0Q93_07600 [Terrimicrobiaceae bacterium]|nr:hypothetical protein [Terrimicrobiaceae bacterium]